MRSCTSALPEFSRSRLQSWIKRRARQFFAVRQSGVSAGNCIGPPPDGVVAANQDQVVVCQPLGSCLPLLR
jgi:hypothetical protein